MLISHHTLTIIEQKRLALAAVCHKFDVSDLWVMGSRSRFEEVAESDWDFLFYMDRHNINKRKQFNEAMNEAMGTDATHVISLAHATTKWSNEDCVDTMRDAYKIIHRSQWIGTPTEPRSLLPASRYAEVFEPWSGKTAGYLKANGNVGDWMIDLATQQLANTFGTKLVEIRMGDNVRDLDVIFSAGAGNFGRYDNERIKREWALSTGYPVVVLPQTAGGDSERDHPYHTVWFRDHNSKHFRDQCNFAPDLALALTYPQMGEASNPQGIFLRKGWEQVAEFSHPEDLGDAANVASVDEYMIKASRYEKIITNRLHFAIAGLIQKRHVTLLPNNYHKNRSVWESSLAVLGCHWRDTING